MDKDKGGAECGWEGGGVGRVFRNIYKEHMDKTKVGWDQGWEVGMGGGGGEKWGQLYLNNNKKTIKNQ